VGAQAAALLDAGGPVGDVPRPAAAAGGLRLTAPQPYALSAVALGHGGVGFAPSAYDGARLHRVLRLPDGPLPVVVSPDLQVTWSRSTSHADEVRRQLTTVLALADDLTELWDACDLVPSLRGARAAGAGRVLRAPTAFEDLVGTLATTNASYAASRRSVGALVDGAFPTPEQVARLGEDGLRARGWGYRAPALLSLARAADGGLDVEAWRDPDLPDDEVLAAVRSLPGFGPFAAATALPLLGHRPRPLVLDGWLRTRVPDPGAYARMGRWAGTGVWLAVTARRWAGAGSGGRARRSPSRPGTPDPR
jgi:N-glycosylase/DNA lyase